MTPHARSIFGTLLLALALGCSSSAPAPDDQPSEKPGEQAADDASRVPSTKVIHLYANEFHPSSLTVAPGSTIEFINDDPEQHNITISDLGVDQTLQTNAKMKQTFDKEGTYTITNRFSNGTMIATITVR